jgi:hypothetical protein
VYNYVDLDLDLDMKFLPGGLAGLVAGAKDDYHTTLGARNYSKKYKTTLAGLVHWCGHKNCLCCHYVCVFVNKHHMMSNCVGCGQSCQCKPLAINKL